MDAMAYAMKESSVPCLGTHNWVGDRDRALYNTFDELQFTHTRAYGATDISGFQGEFDYAAVEPLIAFAQKECLNRERRHDHDRSLPRNGRYRVAGSTPASATRRSEWTI